MAARTSSAGGRSASGVALLVGGGAFLSREGEGLANAGGRRLGCLGAREGGLALRLARRARVCETLLLGGGRKALLFGSGRGVSVVVGGKGAGHSAAKVARG